MTNLIMDINKANIDLAKLKEAVASKLATKTHLIYEYAFYHVEAGNIQGLRLNLETKTKVNVLANTYFDVVEENVPAVVSTPDGNSYAIVMKKMGNEELIEILHEGVLVAYYDPKNTAIYMPYSLSDFDKSARTDIFILVLEAYYDLILKDMRHPSSWMGQGKASIQSSLEKALSADSSRELREAKSRYDQALKDIQSYQERLKREFDTKTQMSKLIASLESGTERFDNFFNGLDQIANHPGVTEVIVENNVVKVNVEKVYAYATVGGKERRYYIGNMRIEMNFTNTDVKFFGDNPHRSHWTDKDPHPHVNGRDGSACLGNASASIAELCSQKEIYALFIICLDFLQNANPEDAAGKNIVRWPEVDEEGNVINKGHAPRKFRCARCENERDAQRHEHHPVFTHFADGKLEGGRTWDKSCIDRAAVFNSKVNQYVLTELVEQIDQYEGEIAVQAYQVETIR